MILTDPQLAALIVNAGDATEANRAVAFAVVLAESGADTNAVNHNPATPTHPASVDRSLWQLNGESFKNIPDACAFDPQCSTAQVYLITNKFSDFHLWTSFRLGTHDQYLSRALAALQSIEKETNMTIFPNPLPAWLTINRVNTYPKWEIIRVEYIDTTDPRNNGSTNCYVKTLDKNGNYQAGVTMYQQFPSGKPTDKTKAKGDLDFNNEPFGLAWFQSGDSSFDPNKGQAGPYTYGVDGVSDTLSGCGLPLRRHIQYLVVWQWNEQPTPPPPPPVGSWQLDTSTLTQPDATHIQVVNNLIFK